MAMATSVAIAAPATPSGRPVPQPKISTGASTMLMITVAVCTIMPGLKLPVPRSAARHRDQTELQRHRRDEPERDSRASSGLVAASALSALAYG